MISILRLLIVMTVLGALCAPVIATGPHDAAFYTDHPAMRRAMLHMCRGDSKYARDVDCLNATSAEGRVIASGSGR